MKKTRILFEGLSENIGGIEKWVYDLYDLLDKSNYEVSFLIDKEVKMAFQEFYEGQKCKIYKAENRRRNYFQYLKDLKEIYTKNEFDIIHINMMGYSVFERITYACKYTKAKIIVHCHTAGYSKNCAYKKTMFLNKLGKKFVKKYKNRIIKIACSESAGKFAFDNESFEIIQNGIDVEMFKFSKTARKKVRANLGIKESETVLGLVGMFNNPKNHNFLIDVFNEYLKIEENSKLILVGEGYLKPEIKAKIELLKIESKVIFLGQIGNVGEVLSALDFYVMPSLYEGISLALLEAQANGLSCFASTNVDHGSDVTGNVEFISLDETAANWAKVINDNVKSIEKNEFFRDEDVMKKFPKEIKKENSYKRVFEIYNRK